MSQQIQDTQDNTTIAFIQARWHADIVDQSRLGFIEAVTDATQGKVAVEVFDVPGAYEIPLLAKTLAKTGNYAAVVGGEPVAAALAGDVAGTVLGPDLADLSGALGHHVPL